MAAIQARAAAARELYTSVGQGQVFKFFDKLSQADQVLLAAARAPHPSFASSCVLPLKGGFGQVTLLDQLDQIDVKRVVETYKLTMDAGTGGSAPSRPDPLERVDKLFHASNSDRLAWQNRGLSMIDSGAVAFLLLAGGQGTRLGTSDPKGCFDIGLPSHKSLFQLMAERLRRVAELSKGVSASAGDKRRLSLGEKRCVPWYIMTSPQTDEATQSFFKKHAFFGLQEKDVFFFQQGTLPCLSTEGHILLETPCTVTSAPDGNGGIYRCTPCPVVPPAPPFCCCSTYPAHCLVIAYHGRTHRALEKSGALSDMRKRGVEVVHCSSVDNALVLAADPLFIGYCVEMGADCGAKVCAKARAEEAVGVLCAAEQGGAKVVEYSELEASAAKEIDAATGELRLNAGNICNHFYTVDFLQAAATMPTPFHVAKKKIPCVDDSGATVSPAANNGIKLEMFIFDCFPHSAKFACAEVLREHEFGPVKNAPGSDVDSPDTARALLLELGRQRALAVGATISGEDGVEISPLLSYSGEGLEKLKDTILEALSHVE
jgi:UDP-N-acetylglucosamine/UDP-N-acetylgalactosamine diphosphorylase